MSSSPRTTKPRKGPDAGVGATRGRGGGVWRGGSGAGNGGAFAPSPGRQFGPAAFPPLQQAHGPAHHFMLTTLVNSPVILTTRTNQRLEGILTAVAAEDGTPGAALRNARDVANAGVPVQEQMFIPAQSIASCVPAQGTFRTDGDISATTNANNGTRPAWSSPPPPSSNPGANVDDLTFGAGSTGASQPWDQFQANEKMFGVVTSFNEEAYTTALDRNAPDFKEKERKAEIIAKEIMAGSTNNSHLAEERGAVDDSGLNEEDKYSSVVRSQNAYIPPGARRSVQTNGSSSPSPAPTTAKSPPIPAAAKSPPANASAAGTAITPAAAEPKAEVPKLAINGAEAATGNQAKAGENNLVGSFREFVTNEKQRLTQKKQAIVKSEKEKRMAELVAFSQNFKLNKPIPKDLVSILTKDSEKAKAIVEKSSQDAASVKARNIGGATTTNAAANPSGTPNPGGVVHSGSAGALKKPAPASGTKPPKMVIQAIPPFNPNKGRAGAAVPAATATVKKDGAGAKDGLVVKTGVSTGKKEPEREPSPTSAAFRLNVNASLFKPGHGPSASVSAGPTPSPKPKVTAPETAAAPPNPFYGTRTFKKAQMAMLKEEFNPFKFAKVADAASVPSTWPYTGRKFMLLFSAPATTPQPHPAVPQPTSQPQPQTQSQPPQPQQQQPPPHPQHPPPPPMQQQTPPVPGPYEDDHGRSPYMQMYPYGYPYPGQPQMQPMMQVPPGSGPPGYMQAPYMQTMPYPQHQMPPNQPMYGAPMPGMPHMAYMPPPPPGPYPPGGAPRGSMPPPHGYYHQSPQLGHTVPYSMMMQGPPGAPTPHPYDPQGGPPNGPPGPLGVGH